MVTEIPDDPHSRAVAMARSVLLATGMLCSVLATAVFFGRLIDPTWAFICFAALPSAAAFVRALRPVWVVALVLFFVER